MAESAKFFWAAVAVMWVGMLIHYGLEPLEEWRQQGLALGAMLLFCTSRVLKGMGK